MPYSKPLCKKCLHPEDMHSEVVSRLQNGTEIRRCTTAICSCIVTFSPKTSRQKEAQVH
ncbi:MAG TPA: hypothetical protein VHL10_06400 [Nitrososphaera sp.]|nr:hypothetical protein [Nitrososphaera sp.]